MDVPADFTVDRSEIGSGARHALDRFEKLSRALNSENFRLCVVGPLHLTLGVAVYAEAPTFFFAADDEFRDIGCRATAEIVEEFAGRFADFLVRYRDRRMSVLVPNLGRLRSFSPHNLQRCIRLKDVTVTTHNTQLPVALPYAPAEPQKMARDARRAERDDLALWNVFYRFPVELWPPEAGDPGEVLGLGTWTSWSDFGEDFAVVFTHLPKGRKSSGI